MLIANNASERANWEVLWIAKGKLQRKDCGHDLTEAMRIYSLVKGKRSGATLRCKNMGFPPPDRLLPRKVRGKRHGRIVTGILNPLKKLNNQGIWWCPYCRELRRFKETKGFRYPGTKTFISETRYVCPICSTPHRDHNVRRWNPLARKITASLEQKQSRSANRTPEERKKARQRRKRRKEE